MSKIKDGVLKSFIAVFALVFLISTCIVVTTSIKPKAAETEFDLAKMSKAATTYFNWSQGHGGAYMGTTNPDPGIAAGLVGFQSDLDDSPSSYVFGGKDSGNGIVYSFEGLYQAHVTDDVNASKPYVDAAKDIADGTSSSSGSGGEGTQTSAFVEYAGYGYFLSELGFDQVGTKGGSLRMVSGIIMLAVYVLSTALSAFMSTIVSVLRYANPFSVFETFSASAGGTGIDGATNSFKYGMSMIAALVSRYYNVLKNFSKWLIIPFLLIIALCRWMLTDNPKSFWPHMKNFFIRFVFVAIGVPMAFSIYDSVLDWMQPSVDDVDTSSTIITSTFLDFESWAKNDNLDADYIYMRTITAGKSADKGVYYSPSNDSIVNARNSCYSINHKDGSVKGNQNGITDSEYMSTYTTYEFGFVDKTVRQTDSWTREQVVDLLKRYAQGDVLTSAGYSSSVAKQFSDDAVMDTSRVYQCFDPYQISTALKVYDNNKGVSQTDAKSIAEKRYSGRVWTGYGIDKNPWLVNGTGTGTALRINGVLYTGRLSWMGTYNYLNSEFTKNGIVAYAPDTTSDQNIKTNHYSVNLVGKGLMSLLYYLDAIILMGCITIIGYMYGGALLIGNFKAIFQVIPNVFSGMFGSMRGIGNTIALLFAVIANIVLTLLMFSIASDIYMIAHYLIQQPVALMVESKLGGFTGTVLYMLSMIISMLVLCTVTSKLLVYRKAVCQAASQGLTEMVSKFVGTNLSAPNLQGNGGTLQTLGAAAAGLGLAAANGAFDNLDAERMGLGTEGFTQGNVGETLDTENKQNPFGVVGGDGENSLNGEALQPVGDEDSGLNVDKSGNLVNEDGTPLTDSEGNAIGMNDDGNLVDSDGNLLTDENGDPIKADMAHLDEDGNLVDADGNAITDASGGAINDGDTMAVNEDGELTDANGDAITDEQGNGLHVDENGNVVDSEGNAVTDSHGKALKQDPKTGKIVDSEGNAVKTDAKGNFRDKGGKGGAVKKSDGSTLSNNPTAQAHANGNITDSNGNVLTDENGDPLRIDDDPYARDENGNVITDKNGNPVSNPNYDKVVDGQGNVVTDSKGNELSVGSGGVVRDGDGNAIRADENGVMTDGEGEPIMAAQTDENGEVVMDDDGKPVPAGGGNITNDEGYSGPNTAIMGAKDRAQMQAQSKERAGNADKQAQQYLDNVSATAGAAGAGAAAAMSQFFSKGSDISAGGNSGKRKSSNPVTHAIDKLGSKLGFTGANADDQTGALGHTDAGLMLENGNQVNDIPMPDGSTAGVVTDQGFMSQAEADDKGLDGVSAIQTEDGDIIYGVTTDGNDFVPGIETDDGFIPGVTSNGAFVPGGFDTNGNFHAGIYTNNGFTEGAFKNGKFVKGRTMPDGKIEAGEYTQNGFERADGTIDTSADIPDMGNAAVGGSVVANQNGAKVVDSNGDAAQVYSNDRGNLAIGTVGGGRVAAKQNKDGTMSLSAANGKQIDIKSGDFDQMQLGNVDADVANGGISLQDGTGGAIPVTSNSLGYATIGSGNDKIALTTTAAGETALSTGDGNAVGMYTAEDGSLRLQTRGGDGIPVTALDDGSMGIVDSNGNVMPITTHDGHLAIQNGNDFIPLTSDSKGNVMMGNNKANGVGAGSTSAYLIPSENGGVGVNGGNMHYQTKQGNYKDVSSIDGDGFVELMASEDGSGVQLVGDSGQIDLSSTGAGSISMAGSNGKSSVVTDIDSSAVVDGGVEGMTGKSAMRGTYRTATNADVSQHAVSSNMSYAGGGNNDKSYSYSGGNVGSYVNNGASAMVYSDGRGNFAIDTADGKVDVVQSKSGKMSFVTADGSRLNIDTSSSGSMTVGSVSASAVDGGIALNDGFGNMIPITDNGSGSVAIGSGNNKIGLTTTSSGATALLTGDKNAVGVYTSNDGSLRLQTHDGGGIPVVAMSDGGMGIVDSNGTAMPIVTSPSGHLAIQNGDDFVPITADNKGNVMMGNNEANGKGVGKSSAYFVAMPGGGVGLDARSMRYQTSGNKQRSFNSIDNDGVVEMIASGGSGGQIQLVTDSGKKINVASSGEGSVHSIHAASFGNNAVTGVDDTLVTKRGASGAGTKSSGHQTKQYTAVGSLSDGGFNSMNDSSSSGNYSNNGLQSGNKSTGGGYSGYNPSSNGGSVGSDDYMNYGSSSGSGSTVHKGSYSSNNAPSNNGYYDSNQGGSSSGGSSSRNVGSNYGGSGSGNSGGVKYDQMYSTNADISRFTELGGFTTASFSGGHKSGAGVNQRTVRISDNGAANKDFNVVQMIKDNPVATAMILNGIANKNIGSAAIGAATIYQNQNQQNLNMNTNNNNGSGSGRQNNSGGNNGNNRGNNYGNNYAGGQYGGSPYGFEGYNPDDRSPYDNSRYRGSQGGQHDNKRVRKHGYNTKGGRSNSGSNDDIAKWNRFYNTKDSSGSDDERDFRANNDQ